MIAAHELDAYFHRIGYRGPTAATLQALSEIVLAHVSTIPFENLDVLLGRPIALDPAALVTKLVGEERGGYCFEHNGLLLHVLERLGFAVTPLSARVRLQRPREVTPPRTHMFLRVEIDGVPWMADVGVGGLSPTSPVRMDVADEQRTVHEPRRLVHEHGRWFHQVALRGDAGIAWHDVCEYTGEAMPPIDREVANWYTSAHPQSHFRNRLLVARAERDGRRHTLLNAEYTLREADGTAAHVPITGPEHLRTVLAEVFGLRFDPGTRFACEALPW